MNGNRLNGNHIFDSPDDVGTQARKAGPDWSATVSVAALASEDACAPVKSRLWRFCISPRHTQLSESSMLLPLKRLTRAEALQVTGLKPRCESEANLQQSTASLAIRTPFY